MPKPILIIIWLFQMQFMYHLKELLFVNAFGSLLLQKIYLGIMDYGYHLFIYMQ